jgi:hypothetical protein
VLFLYPLQAGQPLVPKNVEINRKSIDFYASLCYTVLKRARCGTINEGGRHTTPRMWNDETGYNNNPVKRRKKESSGWTAEHAWPKVNTPFPDMQGNIVPVDYQSSRKVVR